MSPLTESYDASAECLVRAPGLRFRRGETVIVRAREHGGRFDPGLEFSILRLPRGVNHRETPALETVLVLLGGQVEVEMNGVTFAATRTSLFDEAPSAFHCGAGSTLAIKALADDSEVAVIRSTNSRRLPVRFYPPKETVSEDRGAGLAQDACRRLVRTIFDHTMRPDSSVVVGEVVNYPGRWSSYPGHHHPQPEIYHYRFTQPQGYGHAELGEQVVKVRQGDTMLIPGGLDHAQVSAPGYGMYYLWIVRHLPGRPYKGFTFTHEHTWLLDPRNQGWQPRV